MSGRSHNFADSRTRPSLDVSEFSEPALQSFSRAGRAAHDEDGVVTADGAEHVRP